MSVTRIRARWLVAWDGSGHRVVPDGELVFEGDRILHAGAAWRGAADHEVDARDALVAPGYVNVHVHAGPLAAGRPFDDRADPQANTLGFLQYAAPPADAAMPPPRRDDAQAPGAAPSGSPDRGVAEAELADPERAEAELPEPELAALSTAADLLRGGVTCAAEFGGETGVAPDALLRAGRRLGLRLVVGKGFRSRDYVRHSDGTVAYRDRGDAGVQGLADALAFAEDIVRRDDPWVGAMLFALQVDTCAPALLRSAYAGARELGIPLQVHGAQTPFELETLAREYGRTSVEHLDASGALGPRTILAHGILLSHHSWLPQRSRRDLGTLAGSGAAVAHCPVAMARRGLALESFGMYRRAGVPVAIGTDTYPRDMTAELRWAVYLSRIADRRAAEPTAMHALEAATSTAADLLGRPDLGRLAPDARADIQVVDLASLRTGPVWDPVSSWIHTGVAECVRAVWTGGVQRVRDGAVLGADPATWVRAAQDAAEARWHQMRWHQGPWHQKEWHQKRGRPGARAGDVRAQADPRDP